MILLFLIFLYVLLRFLLSDRASIRPLCCERAARSDSKGAGFPFRALVIYSLLSNTVGCQLFMIFQAGAPFFLYDLTWLARGDVLKEALKICKDIEQ
ncbi:hypothetical protein SAY86_026204 [Trapa natans]|uniref:Uncharacterized protein n=1 Tax=Trapa natans TaxID=22666 RepID=A0AAN7KDE7_TRANT|nr:hypothetical protein SAY86_026204 [Trapa natans]